MLNQANHNGQRTAHKQEYKFIADYLPRDLSTIFFFFSGPGLSELCTWNVQLDTLNFLGKLLPHSFLCIVAKITKQNKTQLWRQAPLTLRENGAFCPPLSTSTSSLVFPHPSFTSILGPSLSAVLYCHSASPTWVYSGLQQPESSQAAVCLTLTAPLAHTYPRHSIPFSCQ